MTLTAFVLCTVSLVLTLLLDLRVSRILRQGTGTPATKLVLTLWPLQVLLHLIVFFLLASTRPPSVRGPQVRIARHSGPGPFLPSFPPSAFSAKKDRIRSL